MSDTMVLEGISWGTYERLREELDANDHHVHLTYDRGCLEIEMSSLPIHENRAWLLSHFVEVTAEESGMEYLPGGSTTFRRGELSRGAEPDACYFLRDGDHLPEDLDPTLEAPDLVIEVDITGRTVDKLGLYAGMGVTEIWRDDGSTVSLLALSGEGVYVERGESFLFPGLDAQTLTRFVSEGLTQRRTAWLKAVRAWVREYGPGTADEGWRR